MDDEGGEVLYENTGASRYFMKSFSKDTRNIRNRKIFRKVTGLKWMKTEALQEDTGFIKD